MHMVMVASVGMIGEGVWFVVLLFALSSDPCECGGRSLFTVGTAFSLHGVGDHHGCVSFIFFINCRSTSGRGTDEA